MKYVQSLLLLAFVALLIILVSKLTIYEEPYDTREFFNSVKPRPPNLEQPESSRIPLKEGTEQTINWDNNLKGQPHSRVISFLHGFSGYRSEMDPFISDLQKEIPSHIFYARLPGHGLQNSKIQAVTVSDWFYSVLDTYSYTAALGKKHTYIGLSTGAGLALMIAQKFDPDACLILISPNFGLDNSWTQLLSGRLGYYILGFMVGHGPNDFNTIYDPKTHPLNSPILDSPSIHQFLELTRIFRETDWSTLKNPILAVYSVDDNVINTKLISEKLSGPNVQIKKMGKGHNLFDWKSPEQTKELKDLVLKFVQDRCQ